MNENWYYSTGNGDTHGPMPASEIAEAAKRGVLTETGSVYHVEKTNGQWVNAIEIPAIRNAIEGRAAVLGKRAAAASQPTPPPVVETQSIQDVDVLPERRSPGLWAKRSMIGVTIGCLALAILMGLSTAISEYTSARDSGDVIHYILPSFASISAYYTHSELVTRSITLGIASALSLIPIYLLSIVVCFVFWFATKPE